MQGSASCSVMVATEFFSSFNGTFHLKGKELCCFPRRLLWEERGLSAIAGPTVNMNRATYLARIQVARSHS